MQRSAVGQLQQTRRRALLRWVLSDELLGQVVIKIRKVQWLYRPWEW
jgi:hypothetical protein